MLTRHYQSIYSGAVIALVELQRSLADDIEESWRTKRILGDQSQTEEPPTNSVIGSTDPAVAEVHTQAGGEEIQIEQCSQSV